MIVLRPTQRLAAHLRLSPVAEPAQASMTHLGDWYASPLFAGRSRLALTMSERSLFCVIVPLKSARTFVDRWRERVAERLRAIGVSAPVCASELDAMGDVVIARTASRRTLGALNSFSQAALWAFDDGRNIGDVEEWLDRYICSTTDYEEPAKAARRLLEGHSTLDIFTLRISSDTEPQVRRRLEALGTHTLADLHRLFLVIFNRFGKAGAVFGAASTDTQSQTMLKDLGLRVGDTFNYVVEPGAFHHTVMVEQIRRATGEPYPHPTVIERVGELPVTPNLRLV